LAEVRYEDLVVDPVDEVRRIYDQLDLGGFDGLLPKLREYVAGQKGYQRNRYTLAPALREQIAARWAGFLKEYGYSVPQAA
jgi:hypothetical protein